MVHNCNVIKQRIHQNSKRLIKDRDIYLKPHIQEVIFLNFLVSNAESANSFQWNHFVMFSRVIFTNLSIL